MKEEVVMHMHDWNNYREQLVAGVGCFGKLNPDTVKGYVTLSGAGQKAGHLDDKTRELIALAVAISLRCDGCIAVHTATARKFSATKDELAEALGVAVAINAGAAVVYSTRALDAFDAAGEVQTNA
jgi:AhpD family alkylhydroperoxidase